MSTRKDKLEKGDQAFIGRLETLLAELDIKALTLSERAGLAPNAIHKILKGAEPRRPNLAAIAKATNVHLDWLILGKGPMWPGDEVRKTDPYRLAREDLLQRLEQARIDFKSAVKEAGAKPPSLDDAFHYRDQLAKGDISRDKLIKILKAKYPPEK